MRKLISLTLIIVLLLPTTAVIAEPYQRGLTLAQLQRKDWYNEGRTSAMRDYEGLPAEIGGFVAGLGLGLLGWGVGYLIVSNMSADVPLRYFTDLSSNDRLLFEDGYADYIKRERRGRFNDGAVKGLLVLGIIIILSMMGE
jgi:hypothetical protein